ncbi:MFS transporter [Kribbella sp.]|uniref:MFS transporter n=1 Tax=Kribbella sp. TaxID=1871183 RepID=UPI002D53AB60|nr:MFS transporter [Kribbella sp.]HZX05009.1 MFS transporter [Kribbella sp.]
MSAEVVPAPRRRVMPNLTGFWVIAGLYGMFLFASSAPSPLYVVYQAQWHFSATTLTVIFAVYVFALLVALVFTGSISDQIGRRPTLLVAGIVQVVAMVTFAVAPGVFWLSLARVLQGIATGIATGALSAWLLDLQPEHRPGLGPTVGSTAPPAGLALGAIGAGVLVQYAPAPTHLVYWLLVAVFAAGLLAVLAVPETMPATASWRQALRPKIGVPAQARGAFIAVTPLLVANWALSGLFLSLGGSLAAGVLHSRSHVVGGLVVLALAGAAVLASLLTTKIASRTLMLGGSVALVIGLGIALVGLHQTSTGLFFTGSVLAGLGFGPAWMGAFRLVITASPADQRAALVSAIFVVSYLAFSVPAIIAGIVSTHLGLLTTTTWYGGIVMVLTVAAAVATLLHRELPARTPRTHCPACPGTTAPHPTAATTE